MSFNHININQLTNLEANYYLGVESKSFAQRIKLEKINKFTDIYDITRTTVQEIYNQYLINKSRCGRKPIVLSKEN